MGGGGQGSFTYNYSGDGKLSISSSNSSVATAYIDTSLKTVYITYIGAGSCTITINAAQTPNYNSASAACSITCSRSSPSLTLSTSKLTVYGAANSGSFTYSYIGGGSVTASSSNTNIATVSVSGRTIIVTYKAPGSCTITVNVSQTTYYNSASAVCSITCSRTSLTIPTVQSTTVYCTGSYTGPVVYNYNSSLENQSGITGTTVLGTYTITWTLKDTNRYCWSDFSTSSKSVTWNCVGGTINITWTWTYSAGDRNGWITSNLTYKNKWSDYSSGSGYTRIIGPTSKNYSLFVNSSGELITGYTYKTTSYWKDTSAGSGPINGGKYGGRRYIGSW